MRVSRRSLAGTAGVSATTVASLEAGELGHLSVVERVGDALGAGLALAPVDGASFYSMAALSSAWDAWASPADFLEKLYTVIGAAEFDLDPCSPGRHRSRVRARSHFDEADNGLAHTWRGTIYMNPPYGREIAHWTGKALDEVASGRAKFVIGLLPARTDTAWWHRDIARHADIWFLNGRLAFGDGAQPSPFASAIIFWGATDGHRASMGAAFPRAWHVAAQPQPSNGVKPTRHRKSLRPSAGASGTSTLQAADVQAPVGVRS